MINSSGRVKGFCLSGENALESGKFDETPSCVPTDMSKLTYIQIRGAASANDVQRQTHVTHQPPMSIPIGRSPKHEWVCGRIQSKLLEVAPDTPLKRAEFVQTFRGKRTEQTFGRVGGTQGLHAVDRVPVNGLPAATWDCGHEEEDRTLEEQMASTNDQNS